MLFLSREGPPQVAPVQLGLEASPHRGATIQTTTHGSCVLGISVHEGEERGSLAVEDDLAAVIAGDITNCDELIAELRVHGFTRRTPNSAGVVLAAYRAFGDAAPTRMRGEYAVAISDQTSVRCFRDHLGFGTLFTRDERGAFIAASEAKQVAAAAGLRLRPAMDVLESVFYAEETDDTGSFIVGVDRLPKATILHADRQRTLRRRYWNPEFVLEAGSTIRSEIAEGFHALMGRAVGRVLTGRDVLALSGGIDSPTIAAYAAGIHQKRFGRPLPAISMVFPDYPECDESRYVMAIADYLGMRVDAYQPSSQGQSLARLAEWVRLADGPWGGAWAPGMDEERYTRMSSSGATNVLTGGLAEFVMDFPRHMTTHLLTHMRVRPLIKGLRAQRARGTSLGPIARQLVGAFVPSRVLRAYRQRRPRLHIPAWVDRRRVLRGVSADLTAPRERWRRQQLAAFIGPGISMEAHQIFDEAHGVQVRRPWVDVDLWEFFLGLRAEDKFPAPQSKGLVRAMMRGRLPDSILDRRDKTLLNEFVRANFDYPSLKRWLVGSDFRMEGVDYKALYAALDRQDFGIFDYLWAKDLAAVHAFVGHAQS